MNKYESFVGKVLDGRYKILELVGVGGMATVLKAQDLVMNRIVAIKILNDEYNGDEHAEARFIDESKAVAMLSNKNIVSVYDVAIYPDIKYIVMEYLDGITLREYLDNKGVIGWKEACIYILQILRALEHAHSKGIIHRDIKPQNVILLRNGDIKVTDFGIAKLPNAEAPSNDQKAIGTVYYISPEQACGKETDYYSDIYSVGIMLYEAVTGTLPFIAETPMEVAMMQVNDEPVNPRDIDINIPVGVSQIILKAMEKAPEDRFTSAHSMTKAIEWVLRNPDVIFSMSSTGAEENFAGKTSVISIDMIDTAEIQPYDDEEIAESLGKKNGKSGNKPEKDTKKGKTGKDNEPPKKKKTNRTMFPIIFAVTLAFLIVLTVLGIVVFIDWRNQYKTDTTREYTIPDIKEQFTYYDPSIKTDLANNYGDIKFIIDNVYYVHDPDYENNEIISTDPPGGSTRYPNDDKTIHLSVTVNRLEKFSMPYLLNTSKRDCEMALKNIGFKAEQINFIAVSDSGDNSYYFDGQVLETDPKPGEDVELTDESSVTVRYFSRGDASDGKTAKMPDCIGMTRSDAVRFAQTYAHYKVTIAEEYVANGNNRVIRQSIAAGKVSEINTEVVITVAIPAPVMPSIIGMTISEAEAALGSDLPFGARYYYFASPDQSVQIETVLNGYTDIEKCRDVLKYRLMLDSADQFDDDGSGIIVFQSLRKDALIVPDSTCDLIIVIYRESTEESDEEEESGSDESDEWNG
ncbi:MAG: Stk1 family PASTA domain-containing Ser/Thr kinase [Clostridia bacterium]|nr:Stk1 family PASTA domain-containing Ser/Thr kinase [Clostridia bacterium]